MSKEHAGRKTFEVVIEPPPSWSRRSFMKKLGLTAAAIASLPPTLQFAHAQPEPKIGKGNTAMNDRVNPQQRNLVQYVHFEKEYGYLPGVDEALIAAAYGLDVDAHKAVKLQFDTNARGAAQELLADVTFAERVDRLPFRSGETVVGLGDSFTDDLQSYLEIVRHLLELRRPQDGIRFVNAGVSGYTTAAALRRLVPLLSQKPEWVLCFLGANDAARIGPTPNKPQVSLEETVKNLDAMRTVAAAQTEARWVWITPPTFDEARAAAFPGFQMGQLAWRNDDVIAIGEVIRSRTELVVDIQEVFGLSVVAELQGLDGVHPSLAGQKAIAEALVERLTS